jgi:hypothetical protein
MSRAGSPGPAFHAAGRLPCPSRADSAIRPAHRANSESGSHRAAYCRCTSRAVRVTVTCTGPVVPRSPCPGPLPGWASLSLAGWPQWHHDGCHRRRVTAGPPTVLPVTPSPTPVTVPVTVLGELSLAAAPVSRARRAYPSRPKPRM